MIVVTSAQLEAWLAAFLFPLVRVLALVMSAPIFNNRAAPQRFRLGLGVLVAVVLAPALPPVALPPLASWEALLLLGREAFIGLLLGFSLRLAFAAIDVAGEMIGMQMGLSFAIFYDPQHAAQTPVLSEFLGLLALLVFLALDGHLLTLSLLAESYRWFPLAPATFQPSGLSRLFAWSAVIFSAGLMLALPLLTALLIANLAMGVLARVAPQLNIFAVGFPVTLAAGFLVLMFALPSLGAALQRLFEQAFLALSAILAAGG